MADHADEDEAAADRVDIITHDEPPDARDLIPIPCRVLGVMVLVAALWWYVSIVLSAAPTSADAQQVCHASSQEIQSFYQHAESAD